MKGSRIFVLLITTFTAWPFVMAASLDKYSPSPRMIEQQAPVQQREPRSQGDDIQPVSRSVTRDDMMDLKLIRSLEILRSQTPEVQRQWVRVYHQKLAEARDSNNSAAVEYYQRLIKLATQ